MSFNIALSGIQAINEQLEAVSNNIANSSTYGFKSSRANFAAMYAGDQATGVQVGSLTQNIGLNGSVESTGRSLDAAIDGRGFFVSREASGALSFSRVGIFAADNAGNLIDAAGRKVQGYGPTVNGVMGAMGDIKIPTGQIAASASTAMKFVGNLSADWKAPLTTPFSMNEPGSYNMVKQSVLYDSLGSQHTVSQYFVQTASGDVTVHYGFDGAAPDPAISGTMSFNPQGQLTSAPRSAALTMPRPTAPRRSPSRSTTPAPPASPAKQRPRPTTPTATPRACMSASSWRPTVRWWRATATSRSRPWARSPWRPSATKAH